MHLSKAIIIPLLILGAILAAIPLTFRLSQQPQDIRQEAAPVVFLSFTQAPASVGVNQTFSVNLALDTGTEQVSGTEVYVQFNPAVLRANSIAKSTPGLMPREIPEITSINNTTGLATITLLSNPETPVTGAGSLATISFTALAANAGTTISFVTPTQVAGISGANLEASMGQTIIAVLSPSPTPTPLPTPTPSPTPLPTPTPTPTAFTFTVSTPTTTVTQPFTLQYGLVNRTPNVITVSTIVPAGIVIPSEAGCQTGTGCTFNYTFTQAETGLSKMAYASTAGNFNFAATFNEPALGNQQTRNASITASFLASPTPTPLPTPTPTPTITVSLGANPATGVAPLNGVSLTATVGGTATGSILYQFRCLSTGPIAHTMTTTTNPYTIANLCNYNLAGTATTSVQVTRQGVSASNTALVTVSAASSPTPTPTPITYYLEAVPQDSVAMQVSLPNEGYAIMGILHQDNGSVVTNQTDFGYSWTIVNSNIASIAPFTGCTNGIQPPCPEDHLGIAGLIPGNTTINLSVRRISTNTVVASASWQLTVTPRPSPTPSPSPSPVDLLARVQLEGVTEQRPDQFVEFTFTQNGQTIYSVTNRMSADVSGIYTSVTPITSPSLLPGDYIVYVSGPVNLTRQFNATIPVTPLLTLDLTSMPLFTADILDDNVVDINDFNRMINNFGCRLNQVPPVEPLGKVCSPLSSDLDLDQDVDIFDYSYMVGNYNQVGDILP